MGTPDPGQQERVYIDQVVAYLRTHYRADTREIAALLGVDERDAATYVQAATQQLSDDPEVAGLRERLEFLESQIATRERVPSGYELCCQYTKDHWMRVTYLHCDRQGIAVNLAGGKQGFYIAWTHVANLEKLDRSLEWRPADGAASLGGSPHQALEPDRPRMTAEKVGRALEGAPTLAGWVAIGKALLTGKDRPQACPGSPEQPEEEQDAVTLENREDLSNVRDAITLECREDSSPAAEMVTLEYPEEPQAEASPRPGSRDEAGQHNVPIQGQPQKPKAPSAPRRLEQTATLSPVTRTTGQAAVPPATLQDDLTHQAAQQVRAWCSEESLRLGGKEDRLRDLRVYPCSSRLLLSGDRAWVAQTTLVPAIGGYRYLFVAYRGGQFAIRPLGDFVTALATHLERAWKQRGYADAAFVGWTHPSIERVLLPQVRDEAHSQDLVWVATIRVAFRDVAEVACVVWLHHKREAVEIRVINTVPPIM